MGKLDSMNKLGNPEESKLGPGRINIREAEEVVCEKCGGKVFSEGLMMRRVSAMATGTGQPGIIPIPVFQCTECGHVNREFIPAELR